jgi:hypothetical protein
MYHTHHIVKQTFRDVHHVRQHVPDEVEQAEHEEDAQTIDACRLLLLHLFWALHKVDLLRQRLHFLRRPQGNRSASFVRAPPCVCTIGVIRAQVPSIVDAHIVALHMGVEEPLAPVAPIGTSVLHARTFAHAGVIPDPVQEDDLEPKQSSRVGDPLGVVCCFEPLRLPPQALVHEDRHERVHTRWIPARWKNQLNSCMLVQKTTDSSYLVH